MSYLDGRPREALTPAPLTGLDRLPTRWRRRLRVSTIAAVIVTSEWVSIALAHLLGL